jgi:hypothetical protein
VVRQAGVAWRDFGRAELHKIADRMRRLFRVDSRGGDRRM